MNDRILIEMQLHDSVDYGLMRGKEEVTPRRYRSVVYMIKHNIEFAHAAEIDQEPGAVY